jgi:hypothetical protein
MDWVTIDFEASCLPRHGRSFPIEVGVSGPWGTRSWLIRPLPEWREWDWTEEAYRLHGISWEQLEEAGQDPAIVVAEVRQALGASRVIADSTIDRIWWQTLLDAGAGAIAPSGSSAIRIEHVADVLTELGASHEQIMAAQWSADMLCPGRHRAGPDAFWLFTLLSTLLQRVEADRMPAIAPQPSAFAWAAAPAGVRPMLELEHKD